MCPWAPNFDRPTPKAGFDQRVFENPFSGHHGRVVYGVGLWIPRAGFDSRLCPLGWFFPHYPRGKVHSRAMNTAAHVAFRTPGKRPHPSG